jgi:hypothetical protein
MGLLKKKVRPPAPSATWPHYVLLGTLRRFGHEVGFSLPVIDDGHADPNEGAPIRVHIYRNGTKQKTWEPSFDAKRRHVVVWQREWEGNAPPAGDEEDLIAVEYRSRAAAARRSIDAQIFWRSATEYGSVLVATVRLRPAHFRFSPIVHAAHYYAVGDNYENFTWLLNLKGDEAPAGEQNRMLIDYYARSGAKLSSRTLTFPCNSAMLVPLSDGLAAIGSSDKEVGDGVVAHFRGGASQFAIYTIIRNRASGALGLEHSMAPHSFVYALGQPEIRARFLQQLRVEG